MSPPAKRSSTEETHGSLIHRAMGKLRVSPPLRPWLSMGVALVVLNFSLTFHNVWPTPWITTHHELSVEIAVLLLALVLYSRAVRLPSRGAMTGLALLLVVFSVGRYAEVTAPALYGRPVNVYWDGPHMLNVVAMLNEAASPLVSALVGLGLVILVISVFALFKWCLTRVHGSLAYPPTRRTLAAVSAGVIALYLIGYTPSPVRTLGWFSLPVSMTYWRQAEFTLDAYERAKNPDAALCSQSGGDFDFARVAGSDVFVVFLESYGATTYDRAELSQALAQGREELAEAIASSGREVVSAYVESPTFGGGSWLAHMSLLAGRPVRDNGTYNLLLTQDCEVLTGKFARHGYRVVGLMPGLKGAWPEGSFYGFDAIYGESGLAYGGPEFGWWRIPDQYALAKLDQLELVSTPRAPLFVFFPTISSHMPFRPTPPYQPDWARMLTGEPYDPGPVAESLAVTPDWTNLGVDYADTVAYSLKYLGGYLRHRPELDLVLVLLGDHQPPASVSGAETRWDVPVHVIASRGEVLDTLLAAGFVAGLRPRDEAIGPMHALTTLLLRASSSPARPSLGEALSVADQPGVDITGSGPLRQVGDELSNRLGIEPLTRP